MIPRQIIKEAIKHYGVNNQLFVAIEEMAELQKELSKYSRGTNNREHIVEEIGDVQIMLEQLVEIFGIDNDELFTSRMKKLRRLEGRIEDDRKKYQTNEEAA